MLLSIANAYKEKNDDVIEQAKMVESAIAQAESFAGRSGQVSHGVIDAIMKSAFSMFDARAWRIRAGSEVSASFGAGFADRAVCDAMLDDDGRGCALNVIVTTLTHMANGGVYDQLAGGFHRYSVDERWVVPHFEKMCYDNSELLKNYVHGYQVTGAEFFAEVVRDIIRWMDEWLSDRERGGFYASQDADISTWMTMATTSPGRSTKRAPF